MAVHKSIILKGGAKQTATGSNTTDKSWRTIAHVHTLGTLNLLSLFAERKWAGLQNGGHAQQENFMMALELCNCFVHKFFSH